MLRFLPAYLLAILGAAGAVAGLGLHETGVRVVCNIPASLPPLSMPAFSWDLIQTFYPVRSPWRLSGARKLS